MAREGVPLVVIETVHARRAPMIPVTTSLNVTSLSLAFCAMRISYRIKRRRGS
jgi:hypothetical protein